MVRCSYARCLQEGPQYFRFLPRPWFTGMSLPHHAHTGAFLVKERRLSVTTKYSITTVLLREVAGNNPREATVILERLKTNGLKRMVSAMADRVLRGSRMGAVSYETDRDHDLAPRQMAKYRTPNGEVFEVPFADDAEIPEEWMCKNGQVGTLMEGEGVESKPAKPPRTHWDMLRERRTIEELDVLLEERLEQLRKRRRTAARIAKEQQQANEG